MEKSASKKSAKKKKFSLPEMPGWMEFLLVFALATVATVLVIFVFREQVFDFVVKFIN